MQYSGGGSKCTIDAAIFVSYWSPLYNKYSTQSPSYHSCNTKHCCKTINFVQYCKYCKFSSIVLQRIYDKYCKHCIDVHHTIMPMYYYLMSLYQQYLRITWYCCISNISLSLDIYYKVLVSDTLGWIAFANLLFRYSSKCQPVPYCTTGFRISNRSGWPASRGTNFKF